MESIGQLSPLLPFNMFIKLQKVFQEETEVPIITNTCGASIFGVVKVEPNTDDRSLAYEFESFYVQARDTNVQRMECLLRLCDKSAEDCGSKAQDECPNEATDKIFGYRAFK